MTNTSPQIAGFFDPATSTVSYLLLDPLTRRCALIDSVLDYDPKSGRTSTASADQLLARVAALSMAQAGPIGLLAVALTLDGPLRTKQ